MPRIDVDTLLVTAVLLHVAAVTLVWSVWRGDRSDAAAAHWLASGVATTLGLAVLLVRPVPAPIWSLYAYHLPIQLGLGLFVRAALLFDGRRAPAWIVGVGPALVAALLSIPAIGGDLVARITVASVAVMVQVGIVAAVLAAGRVRAPLPSRMPLAGLALAVAATQITRLHVAQTTAPIAEATHGTWIGPVGVVLLVESVAALALAAMLLRERAEARHRRNSRIDPLTGILNRGAFAGEAEARLAEPAPAALMLFDIDRFKEVNDTFGHAAGDRVISTFAAIATARLGRGDLLGRWGGEEFALLLDEADLGRALRLAEEIRRAFASTDMGAPGRPLKATVSVGVAMTGIAGTDLDRLLAAADAGLYAAKRAGRDRVAVRAPGARVEAVPPALPTTMARCHGFGL